MLTKNKIKYIRSLELKKNRSRDHVFVAEGHKLVGDIINAFQCVYIAATPEWIAQNESTLANIHAGDIDEVTPDELRRISFQDTPQHVLAVFRQRKAPLTPPNWGEEKSPTNDNSIEKGNFQAPSPAGEGWGGVGGLSLALDDIQNPGNLGTIIRLADWFGIEDIYCSRGCADVYSPKTIQATMGAIAHVRVHYVDLVEMLSSLPQSTPIYGTFLDGDNMYERPLSNHGVIVMGNEGKGVSPEVAALVTERLYIPNYPQGRPTAESLNVAIATAIVCAEFRRNALF